MELSGIVPLPISVVDNAAAAFLPLAGQSSLARIVSAMRGAVTDPRRVVVAAAAPLVDEVRAVLDPEQASVVAVDGRPTRSQCLGVAVEHLVRAPFPTRHVLVGDIAHPLAPAGLHDRVVAALRAGATVVVPALVVTDSVKAVDARDSVTATFDRSALRAVQYPRGYTLARLTDLLAQCPGGDDELEVALRGGAAVTPVDGDPDAFRAELPRDAEFVDAIIAGRRPSGA